MRAVTWQGRESVSVDTVPDPQIEVPTDARHRGATGLIGIDPVPARLEMARRHGIEVIDQSEVDDVVGAVLDLTGGRGVDGAIDAVGKEAHGSPAASVAQRVAGLLPDAISVPMIEKVGIARLDALHLAIRLARRGGTVSISGVHGGAVDPMPMMETFDKQLTLRLGQANVRRWVDDLLPLVTDDADPLGVLDLRTHRMSLEEAPGACTMFQEQADDCITVVLDPHAPVS